MMEPIVLIGRNGQLGRELLYILKSWGVKNLISFDRTTFDLSKTSEIISNIQEIKPRIVINAAAYTAVDKAESEPELAHQINAIAPSIIAQETQKLGAFLIHYSTDYVFNGKQSFPYQETDLTNPLNVYGKSKLEGEIAIQRNCDNHLLIRTSWVYGNYGKGNFVKTMLRLGKEKKEIRVVVDQIGSPTWTNDLAKTTVQAIAKKEAIQSGIYHYTNSGVASWYDFAVAIFAEAKQLGFPMQLEKVIPITTSEYPTQAQRPNYSVLSSHKMAKFLGTHPPHWHQSLRDMLQNLPMINQ